MACFQLSEMLPCSKMELKAAKHSNLSRTINSIIKCCYKEIDLKGQNYTKLRKINPELMDNIFRMSYFLYRKKYFNLISSLIFYWIEYVKYIHAPRIISQGEFSSAISLRSRHLTDKEKNKENVPTPSAKNQNKKSSKKILTEREQHISSSREVSMENSDY